MLSVFVILVLIAVALTVASAVWNISLHFAMFVICLIELLRVLPR